MNVRLALALWLTTATAFAGSQVTATHASLATASPAATRAGLDVLHKGGNAVDAAVAVTFALSATYPQAQPIGGGGFLLYYDASQKSVWALDFDSLAPNDVKRETFQGVLPTGPRAVAVPGTVAGMAALHKRFGSRPWKELVAPSAALAREGTKVDFELSTLLANEKKAHAIDQYMATKALFYPDGAPAAVGTKIVQPELAVTLDRIAEGGARAFYEGATAQKLVEGIRGAGGVLSFRDLREYQPVWRSPLQVNFRGTEIHLAPPPSGGGFVIASALQILSGFPLQKVPFLSPSYVHLVTEATRRAFIDRNRYVGDPLGIRIPYRDLLSPARAEAWRKSIDASKVTPTTTLTEPSTTTTVELPKTTHFTIADAAGNVIAVTITLGGDFGSGFVVPGCGFFINEELRSFSLDTTGANGETLATGGPNLLDSRKRPAWSASPTIVTRNGKAILALGTPGGARMPTTVLQILLGSLVYDQPLASSIAAARFHQQDRPEEMDYESSRAPQPLLDALAALGHPMAARDSIGDVQAIEIRGANMTAISDPRHGGAAGGF
jgi:gamma-glutamyltranspeptidase / glutathione hydrolase